MTETGSAPPERACPHCGAELTASDTFCTSCGKSGDGAMRPRGRGGARRRHAKARRGRKLAWAAIILLVLGVLYTVVGLVGVIVQPGSALIDASRQILVAEYGEDGIIELDNGETLTVDEYTEQYLNQARTLMLVAWTITLALGLIYIGLFFWARVNPLPAMVTGLCIFLVSVAAGALVDPSSLLSVFKIVVLLVLIVGVRAALNERAAREQDAAVNA